MNKLSQPIATEDSQSLRAFLAGLSPEEILHLKVRRTDFLMSALVQELEDRKEFPVVELTDPDTGSVCVANVFAERGRLRRADGDTGGLRFGADHGF